MFDLMHTSSCNRIPVENMIASTSTLQEEIASKCCAGRHFDKALGLDVHCKPRRYTVSHGLSESAVLGIDA